MKLRIEQPFQDKYTGEDYAVGSEVDFDKNRAEELLADDRGLVSKVAEAKAEADPASEEPKKATKEPTVKKQATKKKK